MRRAPRNGVARSSPAAQAGIPAAVYIEGTKQTALQYLAEPITTTVRRAGRLM